MRNGYAWPMASYVLAADRSLTVFATDRVVALLRDAGFDVTQGGGDTAARVVVRGRVLRAYADFIYTVQTTTRLQVDLWRDGSVVDTRVYEGFAHPFVLDPAGAGTGAFSDSFGELFAAMARDLPERVTRVAHSAGGAP
jgi:hypothetical protein